MTYQDFFNRMTEEELRQEIQVDLSSLEEGVKPGTFGRTVEQMFYYEFQDDNDEEGTKIIVPKGTVFIKVFN